MIISYVIFNVLNVIIQTVKSIVTIKCNKYVASIVNAVAYGLYTYVIILTNLDINLWFKILVVGFANLIGVFVVKYFEEKSIKDKLWKIELSVDKKNRDKIHSILKDNAISHNYIDNIGNYTIFNIYCKTRKESEAVKQITNLYNAKYFVSESKIL